VLLPRWESTNKQRNMEPNFRACGWLYERT